MNNVTFAVSKRGMKLLEIILEDTILVICNWGIGCCEVQHNIFLASA